MAVKTTKGNGRAIRRACDRPRLDDYAFHLDNAFLEALDVRLTERQNTMVLTAGDPPLYSFKAFDTMHAYSERFTAQVRLATPDRHDEGKIDGEVTFYLYERTRLLGSHTCTQTEFVGFLMSGRCARLGLDLGATPT